MERVNHNNLIVLSPQKYIPVQLAKGSLEDDEVRRLDLALAWGGYGGYGRGYGAGYGGWAGYGWGRWAVSFLVIYALWGLLW